MYIYICIRALFLDKSSSSLVRKFLSTTDLIKIVSQMSPIIFIIIAGGEGERWRVATQSLVYGTQRLKVKRIQVGS